MNPHSDLPVVEGRLRDGLRDPFWPGRTPDADALLLRVARARRRRPVLITACLAMLVIAVGATYAVAGRSLRAAPPAAPPSPLPSNLATIWPPQAYFADARHGFVLLRSCAGVLTSPLACQIYLAATDDGGLTWRARAVPGATAPGDSAVAPTVLSGADANHLVLQPRIGGTGMFSADGGRTWTALPAPVGTVEDVPPGGLAIMVLGRTGPGPDNVWVVRPDGGTARLAHPPAFAAPVQGSSAQIGVAADGTLWIPVFSDTQTIWHYVSRDRGRTWVELHGPAGAGVFYLTSGPNLFAEDDRTHTLWTSTDGQHWDPVPLPFSTAHLVYEPRPDGSLLLGDPAQGRAYLAQGLHYTEVPVDEHMFAQHIGAGCIKAVRSGAPFNLESNPPAAYDVAPDCVHWGRFPFPVG